MDTRRTNPDGSSTTKSYSARYYDEGLKTGEEKGKAEGKVEGYEIGLSSGYSKLLNQQIQMKFHVDVSTWLSNLTIDQLQQVSQLLMSVQTFKEIQNAIQSL